MAPWHKQLLSPCIFWTLLNPFHSISSCLFSIIEMQNVLPKPSFHITRSRFSCPAHLFAWHCRFDSHDCPLPSKVVILIGFASSQTNWLWLRSAEVAELLQTLAFGANPSVEARRTPRHWAAWMEISGEVSKKPQRKCHHVVCASQSVRPPFNHPIYRVTNQCSCPVASCRDEWRTEQNQNIMKPLIPEHWLPFWLPFWLLFWDRNVMEK